MLQSLFPAITRLDVTLDFSRREASLIISLLAIILRGHYKHHAIRQLNFSNFNSLK